MNKAMIGSAGMVFAVLLMLAGTGVVQAQDSVPSAVNFQGTLYDPTAASGAGGPLTGVQQVEFRIYDSLTGGTLIWGRSFPVFCNNQGLFNVVLGDSGTWLGGVTNSLLTAFQGPNRFLEMTVSGHGGAITPRQQFASAPYAMHSAYATYADVAPAGFQVNNGLQVVSGGAAITGQGTFQNNVTVNGALNANTLTVANGTVVGSLTVNSLQVSNNAQVAGALQVEGRIRDKSGYVMPVGMVLPYAGSTLPDGWLTCNGAAVARATYGDLFTAIGITYGPGDGTTTFNLPDMQGRAAIGAGQGNGLTSRTLGQTPGEENHLLSSLEMPSHSHGITINSSAEGYSGVEASHGYWKGTTTAATGSAGSGGPHNNMPPSLVLNYIIKY